MREIVNIVFFLILLIFTSCQKDSEFEIQQEKLDSWVTKNINPWADAHGYQVEKLPTGTYYISMSQGTGNKPTSNEYALINFTVRNLSGTLIATDSIETATKNDVYEYDYYYEPILVSIQSTNSIALRETLTKMQEGGTARILFTSNKAGTAIKSTKRIDEPVDIIVNLQKIYHSSNQYELELINNHIAANLTNPIYIDQYFAYQKLIEKSTDSVINLQDNIEISYMVWYLNNQLISTNIEDSARKFNIYQDAYEYQPLRFKVGSNTVIEAVDRLAVKMKCGESVISVFSSNFGYGEYGTQKLPGFCPLKIYFKINAKIDN